MGVKKKKVIKLHLLDIANSNWKILSNKKLYSIIVTLLCFIFPQGFSLWYINVY